MMDTLYYLFCIKEVINLTAVVSVLRACVCVGGLMCEMVCMWVGGVRDVVCGGGGGVRDGVCVGGGGGGWCADVHYACSVMLFVLFSALNHRVGAEKQQQQQQTHKKSLLSDFLLLRSLCPSVCLSVCLTYSIGRISPTCAMAV